MTTIEIIHNFLTENTGIESMIAGTGSLYINYNGHKIRVSDHEEAVTRLREDAEKCFFTRTADNRTFDAADILGDIFEYLSDNYNFQYTKEILMKLYEL